MVTLVVTKGASSMDLYVEKLAAKLDVPKVHTNIYQRIGKHFNTSWFSRNTLRAIWEDLQFIRTLNKLDGIVHLPNQHLGRYGVFLKVPYIITVHDIIRYFDLEGENTFIHRPNLRDRFYLSLDYKGVKKATRVIAVSQTTKDDLVQHLGIPEERISVVYEGIDHSLFKPTSRRLVDHPYLLFVGTEHPRKNFAGLLNSFSKLKSQGRFKDLKVLKVGRAGRPGTDFRQQTLQVVEELGLSSEVVFTDYVAREDLPAYYSGAECFILPSLYEGFGFPPLEAMACGCPVIVSNAASLPEVVGNAAIKVDPDDIDGTANALLKVLIDEYLKQELVSRGFKQVRRFSWQRVANETLKVYKSVELSLSHQHTPGRVTERKGK